MHVEMHEIARSLVVHAIALLETVSVGVPVAISVAVMGKLRVLTATRAQPIKSFFAVGTASGTHCIDSQRQSCRQLAVTASYHAHINPCDSVGRGACERC